MTAIGRELLVLRHAKSAWDTDAPSDFERPLAKRGRRDCPTMAQWLADEGLVPDHVVASPAARARETAERVLVGLGVNTEALLTFDEDVYHAGLGTLLDVLATTPTSARRVMLVGHNPGLDELVEHLAGHLPALSANGKLMVTAAIAHFAMPDDWDALARGAGRLIEIARPRDL